MRSFFSKSKKCCPPAVPNPCPEGRFYALELTAAAACTDIGDDFDDCDTSFGEVAAYSNVSYNDAVNKSKYLGLQLAITRALSNVEPDWDNWTQDKPNTALEGIVSCPCSWVGEDDQTELVFTVESDTITGYWTRTEANYQAYLDAFTQAEFTLDCQPPA
jgi:hypothetical protein